MRYRPKSTAALQIALGGLPDKMTVKPDPEVGLSAKTVGQLRKVAPWPANLVVAIPQNRQPKSAVTVTKASSGTRVWAKS